MRRTVLAIILAACTLASVAGCAAPPGPAPSPPSAVDAFARVPVLSAAALPGLATRTRALTSTDLAKDAAVPDILGQLTVDGYRGGRDRTFQGPSRHLSFVDSRALAFRTEPGAAGFLSFIKAHADAWFGSGTQATPLITAGRPGWSFWPAECACHLANPVLVGVVRDGAQLDWLEINGPDATKALLVHLMTPSLSSTSN